MAAVTQWRYGASLRGEYHWIATKWRACFPAVKIVNSVSLFPIVGAGSPRDNADRDIDLLPGFGPIASPMTSASSTVRERDCTDKRIGTHHSADGRGYRRNSKPDCENIDNHVAPRRSNYMGVCHSPGLRSGSSISGAWGTISGGRDGAVEGGSGGCSGGDCGLMTSGAGVPGVVAMINSPRSAPSPYRSAGHLSR